MARIGRRDLPASSPTLVKYLQQLLDRQAALHFELTVDSLLGALEHLAGEIRGNNLDAIAGDRRSLCPSAPSAPASKAPARSSTRPAHQMRMRFSLARAAISAGMIRSRKFSNDNSILKPLEHTNFLQIGRSYKHAGNLPMAESLWNDNPAPEARIPNFRFFLH